MWLQAAVRNLRMPQVPKLFGNEQDAAFVPPDVPRDRTDQDTGPFRRPTRSNNKVLVHTSVPPSALALHLFGQHVWASHPTLFPICACNEMLSLLTSSLASFSGYLMDAQVGQLASRVDCLACVLASTTVASVAGIRRFGLALQSVLYLDYLRHGLGVRNG